MSPPIDPTLLPHGDLAAFVAFFRTLGVRADVDRFPGPFFHGHSMGADFAKPAAVIGVGGAYFLFDSRGAFYGALNDDSYAVSPRLPA